MRTIYGYLRILGCDTNENWNRCFIWVWSLLTKDYICETCKNMKKYNKMIYVKKSQTIRLKNHSIQFTNHVILFGSYSFTIFNWYFPKCNICPHYKKNKIILDCYNRLILKTRSTFHLDASASQSLLSLNHLFFRTNFPTPWSLPFHHLIHIHCNLFVKSVCLHSPDC